MWVDTIWSIEGLNRTEKQRKREFALYAGLRELEHWFSSALRLGMTPLAPLVLRSSHSD